MFLTWRLFGSLPENRFFPNYQSDFGKVFVAFDRLLDQARTGPSYLKQPAVADMVVDSIRYNAQALERFSLHAFVVMPNHVHLLVTPHVPLAQITKTLKGFTAKQANRMLRLTGKPFWQGESYDHLVRDQEGSARISFYIEQNPVRAGLVREADQYRWSSAGWATWRSALHKSSVGCVAFSAPGNFISRAKKRGTTLNPIPVPSAHAGRPRRDRAALRLNTVSKSH